MGYSPWGHKESDMTEATEHACQFILSMFHLYYVYIEYILIINKKTLPVTPQ